MRVSLWRCGYLSGEPVFRHLPTAGGEAVWVFLRELMKTAPCGYPDFLWDGAGFHPPAPTGALEEEWTDPAKIPLLQLPPCCPKLNVMEKIRNQLHGRGVQSGV